MILLSRAVEVKMPTSDLRARREDIGTEQLGAGERVATPGELTSASAAAPSQTQRSAPLQL